MRGQLLILLGVATVLTGFPIDGFAGALGATTLEPDCGYVFLPHEHRQLERLGWHCDKAEVAVAKKMKKRGFLARQFVEAFRLAHDIPRTTAADVETVAVLNLVDINPRYYFMIDPPNRPSLTAYYNRKLFRRGRIFAIAGYAVAAVGAGLTAFGIVHFGDEKYGSSFPSSLGILMAGAAALSAGTAVGTIGVYKLSLVSDTEILDTGSMEELRKRRTKTHHFAPDDLIDWQIPAPTRPYFYGVIPTVGEDAVGLSVSVVF